MLFLVFQNYFIEEVDQLSIKKINLFDSQFTLIDSFATNP